MPLSNLFSAISNFGTPSTGMYRTTTPEYPLLPGQASSIPLLESLEVSPHLQLGAMPTANYTAPGIGGFLQNYGGTLLGGIQGLGNLFMGMKQYGLAKDALKESKRQFELNYDAQRKLTNARLGDRQDARRAADPERHMTREEYLAQYGV